MSINNIQLKTSLLASLYKNSLVQSGTTTVPDSNAAKYLGNNKKNILVIVSSHHAPYLSDKELGFLTSILSACRLSVADIGIINLLNISQADLQHIIQSEGKNILLFGVEPLLIGLPINFPSFQLQQFDQRTYLYAPALAQVENDKGLKSRLWSALKVLFGI